MAHEISTAVFSAREGAGWTGLGLAIPEAAARDPRQIAELLGATWTVQARPVYYQDNSGAYQLATGAAAQVRSDTGAVLSLTSETRYHTDNRQPVDVLEAFRDELAANKLEISHAAVLRGGAVVAVSALMSPEHDLNVGGRGDILKRYVTLSTGYDKKHGTKATLGTIRVVCANTLAYSLSDARKTGMLKTISAAQVLEFDSLSRLIANVGTLEATERAVFDGFANRRMGEHDVARYFADVLEINIDDLGRVDANGKSIVSGKARNMLAQLVASYRNGPGADMVAGTAWGALNAVTHYATHVKTCRDTAGDGATVARVASNMTGDAAKLKARALALLADRTQLAVAA